MGKFGLVWFLTVGGDDHLFIQQIFEPGSILNAVGTEVNYFLPHELTS